MNIPTSFLQSVTRLLPKQKIPAKFITTSATINTIHQRYTSQFGGPTYPFLHIVIVCISVPPVSFWSHLHQKNTTSFSDLQRLFDLNMKNTPSNLPGVIVMYISSTSSLLVLPIPEKTQQVFRVYKGCLIWTWKDTSKLPGEKGYLYHPERIWDDTISGSPL